jgi:hypothetical protein
MGPCENSTYRDKNITTTRRKENILKVRSQRFLPSSRVDVKRGLKRIKLLTKFAQ